MNLDKMIRAYIECALWSSTDEEGESLEGNEPSSAFNAAAIDDCENFTTQCAIAGIDLAGFDPTQVGHDLWLTRNRHGAGFWDRGLGTIGQQLTELAHGMGSVDLYIGDDGFVHQQ